MAGPKALKLEGQKFGRLTVIKAVGKNKRNNICWLCECDCGNTVKVAGGHLRSGHTNSCGCLIKETTKDINFKHGKTGTKNFHIWAGMRDRCNNPNNPAYKNYGGRGIKICQRWNEFKNFLADMGKKPKGLTLDRIDNDGNYEPKNCRWTTRKEQNRNSRQTKLNPLKAKVIRKLLKESVLNQPQIAKIFNVSKDTISLINTGKIWKGI